ncbi:hypothetical protein BDW72DRAFT_197829 [Aspergillus terricola var. indicus]
MALFIDGVALVTGAGSGIGREVALSYAAEGACAVVAADLNYAAALETATASKALAANPSYQPLAVAVDVSDAGSVQQMVSATVRAFGRIDYAVNCAGVGVQKHLPVGDADAAEMDRFWRVNVLGPFHVTQAVVGVMKEQGIRVVPTRRRGGSNNTVREVGRGVILNVASCNSFMATPNIVQYTTSKHAVIGLTKTAALDHAKDGIRVNAICPGWVETPMVDAAIQGNAELPKMMRSIIPMARIAKPEEIADVVLFMTSPRASYVTGAGWIVDGGTTLQVQNF